MAYFNRKSILGILSEKPDMITGIPECVLSAQQCEDMARIPKIAVCDIAMMTSAHVLDSLFANNRPDAVLPAVAYGGVERVQWAAFDKSIAVLKKHLEKTWHVHVLPPVVLGAPLFRSALCLYSGMLADQNTRLAMQCAACFFYRAAAFIPLCKRCDVKTLYLGGLVSCCRRVRALDQSCGLFKYCKILLSGYGIELVMPVSVESIVVSGDDDGNGPGFECFMDVPGSLDSDPTDMRAEVLQHFFENFAIPFAANVMSRLLAGHDIDFLAAARSFLPDKRKKIR